MNFKVKKIFSISTLYICVLTLSSFGQAPNWEWAETANTPTTEKSICVDNSGNSYVTGKFQNTVTFGAVTLTSNADSPNPNLYLVKYNPWGGVVWAVHAAGHSSNEGQAVAVDDSGNVYLTGFFDDTIIFGSTTFISPGLYGEGFLVKFNPSGNVIWAKVLGTGTGNFGTSPLAIALDHSGNIFVTGYFHNSTATFGSFTLTSPDNGASEDVFLVKCDLSGNVLWAKMAGSTSGAEAMGVTTDAAGNSYITGWFTSPSLTFGFSAVTNNGGYNSFLVKYDPNGSVVWARGIGGALYDYGYSVSANYAGYCYVTGEMYSPAITVGSYTLTNSDSNSNTPDIFIVKFAPNGTVAWARSAGNSGAYDIGRAVVSDSIGNAYVTGYFEGATLTFGSVTSNSASGSANIFVAKFASSGSTTWLKAVGDTGGAEGASIAINPSGDCYITGYFNGPTIGFGSFTLSNPLLLGQFYIAKTGAEAGMLSNEISNYISVYPNPATTNAVFQFPSLNGNKTLIIYDQLGKEIWRKETNENRVEYTRNEIAAGLYFYRIEQEGEVKATGKIVFQ